MKYIYIEPIVINKLQNFRLLKRRINMKKIYALLALSCAILLSSFAPASADGIYVSRSENKCLVPVITGAACPCQMQTPEFVGYMPTCQPCCQPACPCEPCCQPACPCEPCCDTCCPQPACPCEDPCAPSCPCEPTCCDACPCQPACPCEPCCQPSCGCGCR